MFAALKPHSDYKPSHDWIGDVPAHWRIVPGFAAFREKRISNSGMVVSDVLSLSYGRIVVKPPEKLHGLVPASFETYQIVDPGDIIIRPTDLQNDWHSIRVGLARDRGIITSAYICLQPTPLMTPEYCHLLLLAYDMRKFFYGMGSGLRQSLDYSDFKRFPMLVPPPDEQAAIVRFLGAVDRKVNRFIRAKRRLIEVLTEQKQAIITDAVTRGVDPSVRIKPSSAPGWLGTIPAGWVCLPIRRLSTFITSGPRDWSTLLTDDGDLFIQSGNLGRSMELKLENAHRLKPPAGAETERTRVNRDDVLICVTGALTGNVVHVANDIPPAYVNQHVALVRPKQATIVPRFLAYSLHSMFGKYQFKLAEYGGTKQGLSLSDVASALVMLPDRATQQNIVAHLDRSLLTANHTIARVLRGIDLIREYRTRLVADVATGKLDVREIALPTADTEDEGDVNGAVELDEVATDSAEEATESVEGASC